MKIYEQLQQKNAILAVVGLGYVGLPLAIAFAKKFKTIGFDISERKIDIYRRGIDPTGEVGDTEIKYSSIKFTSDAAALQEASFIIVAVPTPVNGDKTPDLTPVTSASQLVGKNLLPGSIVVFESTVYPGVTEDICVPILEKESGLVCGTDFMVGYSPERINPGDKIHRLENIKKIVSGINTESLQEIASVYAEIIEAGVYLAPSLKVAEAAKLVENAQRDINIAFMNELAMVFDRMEISTKDVFDAMATKWNALHFMPGLVGGHCIGIDPWYFVYKAENLGYHSQIIAAGRKINDSMGIFVADTIIKKMIQAGFNVCEAKIYLMGITFKEDCPDIRNSRSFDVLNRLREYHIQASFVDPAVDQAELKRLENIDVVALENVKDADCLVFLVGHKEFKTLSPNDLGQMYKFGRKVLIDVKSIFDAAQLKTEGYSYWSL